MIQISILSNMLASRLSSVSKVTLDQAVRAFLAGASSDVTDTILFISSWAFTSVFSIDDMVELLLGYLFFAYNSGKCDRHHSGA